MLQACIIAVVYLIKHFVCLNFSNLFTNEINKLMLLSNRFSLKMGSCFAKDFPTYLTTMQKIIMRCFLILTNIFNTAKWVIIIAL